MRNQSTSSKTSAEKAQVAVYFHDKAIQTLFSELLELRGVNTAHIRSPGELTEYKKGITEIQFLDFLLPRSKTDGLLIGDQRELADCPVISLSRPLTGDKIETALQKLLA